MNEKTKRGLETLQVALILGVLGDSLFRATPWGLNFFLWTTTLTLGIWLLITRHRENKASVGTIALHAALIFFGAMFLWRDSIQLLVADVVAILCILAVLTLPVMKLKMQRSGLVHYGLGWLYSGFNVAIAPFFLFGDIEWESMPGREGVKHFVAVIRGLLIALPIILVFGVLFVAADAAFQDLVEKTFRIDFDNIIFSHVLLITFLSWITAGYLRGVSVNIFEKSNIQAAGQASSIQELGLKDEPENKADEAETKTKPK